LAGMPTMFVSTPRTDFGWHSLLRSCPAGTPDGCTKTSWVGKSVTGQRCSGNPTLASRKNRRREKEKTRTRGESPSPRRQHQGQMLSPAAGRTCQQDRICISASRCCRPYNKESRESNPLEIFRYEDVTGLTAWQDAWMLTLYGVRRFEMKERRERRLDILFLLQVIPPNS